MFIINFADIKDVYHTIYKMIIKYTLFFIINSMYIINSQRML